MTDLDKANLKMLIELAEGMKRMLAVACKGLDTMACWDEGTEVNSGFENPDMAIMARQTLKEMEAVK